MRKQVAFRCAWPIGVLLFLALSACGRATTRPEGIVAATPTEGTPTASATPPALQAVAHPSETPQSLPPVDVPTAEVPFPALLRTLHFGIPAGNSYHPARMAVHSGLERLYVLTLDRGPYGATHGQVTVLDVGSGEVLFVAETGGADNIDRPLALDTRRNRVYAYNDRDKTCAVLDAATLEPVATLEDVLGFALDEPGGSLYVAGPAGLRVLDLDGYGVLRQRAIPFAPAIEAMAVDPAQRRLYVAHMEGDGFVLDQYDAGTLQELASTICPAGCRAVVPDPARARVYLTTGDNYDSLWMVDGQGQRLQGQPLGQPGPYRALALDSAGDRLFAAREPWSTPGIAVIDLETGQQVGEIALASNVNGMAWDEQHDRLWVTLPSGVGIADPAAGQVIAPYPLAIDLEQAQLKVGGGRLYLTDSIGRLHVLDAATYQELATLPFSGDLTLDTAHNRLYVTSWDSTEGSVAVVDTAALTVTKVLTPGGSVGWDPGRNRLYIGSLGRGGQVYDALSLEKLGAMPVGGQAVYNPLRDELLIVAHTVYRADAETLAFIADLLPDVGGQECPECEGQAFASDVQVLTRRNLLAVTLGSTGRRGVCPPATRFFDATTLEPVPDPAKTHPAAPTCNSQRGLPQPLRDQVYEGVGCDSLAPYRNLRVYDLQGNLRTWRDGLDTGVINPNTCQAYVSGVEGDRVLVFDLPSLTPVGTLPQAAYTMDVEAGRLYGLTGTELLVFGEAGGQPEPPPQPMEVGPLPAGEIVWLAASPGFADDHTLFASILGPATEGLYRSSDRGATWVRLRGGLPAGGTRALAMSPGFATDHTLFAVGAGSSLGVLRSTDAGDTWQPVWERLAHLRVQSLALSPQYATDGTLLAYSTYRSLEQRTPALESVSRSTDCGLSWTLVVTDSVPPPEELLPMDPHSPEHRFRAGLYWGIDRWTSIARSWQRLLRLPESAGTARAVLPSRQFRSDGTVYVLAEAGLFRSMDGGDHWSRCTGAALDGRVGAPWPTSAAWAGDQLLFGTLSGELFFVDPAALRCGSIEVTPLWSSVLAGSHVSAITAEPPGAPGVGTGEGVWLVDQPASRLVRYARGAVQARYAAAADGLPRFPTGLALAADGLLWVSGMEPPGSASFDGKTWTSHPLPGLPAHGWVRDLAAGPDGAVWAVTEPAGVYRQAGEAWERMPDPGQRLGQGTAGIAIAADGSPWIATQRGLAHYARGAWTAYDLGECVAVAVGPANQVYGLGGSGLVWRFAEGVWSTLPPAGTELGVPHALHAARDGSVWIGTDNGAFRHDGAGWQPFTLESGLPGRRVLALAEDSGGGLWFGTDNGAAYVDPDQINLSPVSWPPPEPVPLPALTPTPTPWPSPAPPPTPGIYQVAERFAAAYADGWVAARLHQPRGEAGTTLAAFQPFEHGLMIWRADTMQIYVLHEDGSVGYYGDTWDESQPVDDPTRLPPAGLYQPLRGFGKLWRTEAGLALRLGWAVAAEHAYEMLVQPFAGGTMLLGPEDKVYILLPLRTWERR